MLTEDIQISEELETNAPSIKYSGNEGPKSPQQIEEQMMAGEEQMMAGMMEDIARDFQREFGYDMGLANPEVVTEYIKVWKLRQRDTSRGPVLPSDEDPINPFGPKPEGPVLPDRDMTASSKTYMDYVRAALELGLKPIRIDEFESLTPIMDVNEILKVTDDLNKRSNKATGGRVQAASGGLADILKV